jgi:hypothetical protein
MSKISSVYDSIVSKVETLFPAKTRLHNPYEFSDNPEIIMKDCWGLKVSQATREEIEYCNLSIARDFSFVLIRQFASVGSKDDAFDSVSKFLLEDQQSFLNTFFSPTELGVANIIDKIEFDTIGGIDFVQTEQKKYLFCEIAFKITISEPVI